MMPVLVRPKFVMFGKNIQILFKSCKKWENICKINILWYIRIRFCTLTIHHNTKDISYGAKLKVFKIFYFRIKQSNSMQKKVREIFEESIFSDTLVHV